VGAGSFPQESGWSQPFELELLELFDDVVVPLFESTLLELFVPGLTTITFGADGVTSSPVPPLLD